MLVLEAMKMQTAIPAERDGRIVRVLCKADHVVDTGDLLVEVSDSAGAPEAPDRVSAGLRKPAG